MDVIVIVGAAVAPKRNNNNPSIPLAQQLRAYLPMSIDMGKIKTDKNVIKMNGGSRINYRE